MSDQVATPVETKDFTEAELAVFKQRMQAYQEATAHVNEWVGFLMKQHGVTEGDGWRLGNVGFVRDAKPAPDVNRTQENKRRAKRAA